MLDAIEAVKEKMVLACKVLQKQRVLDGYGHLTARLSDGRILSTPHMPPGKVHYHPDELVAVAAAGQGIKVIANCGVHFYRGTPIYDSPVLIRNHQLGDKVAATLGDRNAVLLRGHGGTVVSNNLDTLLRLGLDLVRSARIQIMAAPLGALKTHSQDECEQMVKSHDRPNANRRYIDYYISEVVD